MAEFSIFWPWYLKILYFSPPYHFQWFSGPFQPFFWKNGKKSEFGRFWPIFRKMALDMPKWPSETPRIGQMASFRMVFDPVTYGRIFGKVYREPSNFCRHALLIIWFIYVYLMLIWQSKYVVVKANYFCRKGKESTGSNNRYVIFSFKNVYLLT